MCLLDMTRLMTHHTAYRVPLFFLSLVFHNLITPYAMTAIKKKKKGALQNYVQARVGSMA